MKITFRQNFGSELIFEAENVKIVEDIESREYPKDENGKSIITLNPKRDIKTEVLEQFVNVLDDMIYYREAEFDSSDLIERLFEKLPQEVRDNLIKELNKDYDIHI